MRRKKLISFLLAFAMLLPICQVGVLAAGQQVDLTLSYETGTAVGKTFTVELLMEGNPGLLAAQTTLDYDRSVLQCTRCKAGDAISGMMNVVNPAGTDGAIVAGAAATPVEGNGVMAVYTFKVLSEGPYGFVVKDIVFTGSDNQRLSVKVTDAGATQPEQPPVDPEDPDPVPPVDPAPPVVDPDVSFTDTQGHWAEEYIDRAVEYGFINGYGDGRYGPDNNMTRAHFVTILWREAGCPEPVGKASFSDLNPKQTYYHKAVAWAEENHVVNGVGEGRFAPDSNVTRQQIATTLYRMNGGVPGAELMFYGIYDQAFADSAQVADWARSAVWWAVYNEIWCGTDQEKFLLNVSPTEAADRAQIAVMIVRYHEL